MEKLKLDDLEVPWFVLEQTDDVFSGNTNREICFQSDYGSVAISLNSVQSVPSTHRRQRFASLMAAAPTLYAALWDVYEMLEEKRPLRHCSVQAFWYTDEQAQMVTEALTAAEPIRP